MAVLVREEYCLVQLDAAARGLAAADPRSGTGSR